MSNTVNVSGLKKIVSLEDSDYVLVESANKGTALIKKKHLFSNLGDLGVLPLSSVGNTLTITTLSDNINLETRTTTTIGAGNNLPPTSTTVYSYVENRIASLSGNVTSLSSSFNNIFNNFNGRHLTLSGIGRIPTLTGDTYLSGGSLRVSKGSGNVQTWNGNGGEEVATLNSSGYLKTRSLSSGLFYIESNRIIGNNSKLILENDDTVIVELGGQDSGYYDSKFFGGINTVGSLTAQGNIYNKSNTNKVIDTYSTNSLTSNLLIVEGENSKGYYIDGKLMSYQYPSMSASACFNIDGIVKTNSSSIFNVVYGSDCSRSYPSGPINPILTLSANNTNLYLIYEDDVVHNKLSYNINILKI